MGSVFRLMIVSALVLAAFASAPASAAASASLASPHMRRGPTAPRMSRSRGVHPQSHATARGIDAGRATQIQTALIKAGYLTGTPTGTWDVSSQAAMERLQADNGWQTKLVPDARAIIRLGLGPKPAGESSDAEMTASDPHPSLQ